jgi:hypothetical protein
MNGLLLVLALFGGTEETYRLDVPLAVVVSSLQTGQMGYDMPLVSDVMPLLRSLPKISLDVHCVITGESRYYRFAVTLHERVWTTQSGRRILIYRLKKTLELWPDDQGGSTIVRSSIDLGCEPCLSPVVQRMRVRGRCLGKLVDRMVTVGIAAAEAEVLRRERSILTRFAARSAR